MSMTSRIGVKSFGPALLFSIVEIALFAALSVGFFYCLNKLCVGIGNKMTQVAAEQVKAATPAPDQAAPAEKKEAQKEKKPSRLVSRLSNWSKGMPTWLWIVTSIIYLFILLLWWAPGENTNNNAELWALAIVAIIGLAILGIWAEGRQGTVSNLWGTLTSVMTDRGKTRVGTPSQTEPAEADKITDDEKQQHQAPLKTEEDVSTK